MKISELISILMYLPKDTTIAVSDEIIGKILSTLICEKPPNLMLDMVPKRLNMDELEW
jgi:hypothetical protein